MTVEELKERVLLSDPKYSLFKNKKTGNIYGILKLVVNATNANDGQEMVLYHRASESVLDEYYVRETNEFLVKFEPLYEL